MTLTQQTFLGASITNFNGSVGWGTDPSTLTVGLVEDPINGDSFDPPSIGSAVLFNYSGWQFGGLLQGYTQDRGEQGNPIYTVKLEDPRQLLAGVQLILNDYAGGIYNTRNIYNIYGYLEGAQLDANGNLIDVFNFGGSLVNETGMPWWLIRNTFYQMQLVTPIYFRGVQYIFDPFYGLDLLPNYYRIAGDSISALDYIQDVCAALACDFHITMIPLDNDETPATNVIKVNLVSRKTSLSQTAINDFVSSVDGAVSKQQGYELSNEVMTKFVVGGKFNHLSFQTQDGTANNYNDDNEPIPGAFADDVITPFWGWNAFDELIIGTGDFDGPTGKEYTFSLDGRPISVQTGHQFLNNYQTDLAEMRAAKAGQKAWESFLWFHDSHEDSIHKDKASKMGLTSGKLSSELMEIIETAKSEDGPLPESAGIKNWDTTGTILNNQNMANEEHRKRVAKIYAYIAKFANEYYGKKFMVRVPFVHGAVVPDAVPTQIKLSSTPTETGYLNEEYWGTAQNFGYLPFNPEKLTSQDNRFYCYVRFSGKSPIVGLRGAFGLDKLSPESFVLDQYPFQKLGSMRNVLFVKASVDPNLVFLNPTTLYSPRAVVTLDGPVSDNQEKIGFHYTGLLQEIALYISDGEKLSTELIDWVSRFGSRIGNDLLWTTKDSHYKMPNMAAIPLENHVFRYGPWITPSNQIGRVEFENDSTLVPWEYGSFSVMDLVGWSKVEDAIISQYQHENGTIEFPGVPGVSMGDALIDAGPRVTDINVDVSENGVTTTYRMNTWTNQFGLLRKYNLERFKDMAKSAQKQKKAFRRLYGYREPITYLPSNEIDKSEMAVSDVKASVGMIGEVIVDGEGDDRKVRPIVSIAPADTIVKSLKDDIYSTKAGISIDGIFVPYSTNPSTTTDLPHFETPTGGSPDVDDLNPFGGTAMDMVFPEGTTVPTDGLKDDGGEIQAVGIRAPIVVGGWGYDTAGDPVPNNGSGLFITNYKDRADEWKTGPLDIRWDNNRKVWTIPPGSGQFKPKCRFILQENLSTTDECANAEIDIQYGQGISHEIGASGIMVYNMLNSTGDYEFYGDVGDYGIASFDPNCDVANSGWYIDIMECP